MKPKTHNIQHNGLVYPLEIRQDGTWIYLQHLDYWEHFTNLNIEMRKHIIRSMLNRPLLLARGGV